MGSVEYVSAHVTAAASRTMSDDLPTTDIGSA
jgi:hypothetical protein